MDSKICRVCLDKTATICLFDKQDDAMYCDKIMRVVNVTISEGDGLPDSICENCATELCVAYEFSHKCEASDRALRCLDIIQTKTGFDIKEEDIKAEIEPDLNSELYEDLLLNNDFDNISETTEKQYKKKKVKVKTPSIKLGAVQCDVCGHVAVCQSALERHMRTHTGERPYICHMCNASFNTKYSLKKHIVQVHSVNDIRDSNTVTNKLDRRKNRPKSGPLQCVVCGLITKCKSMLETHMRSHTGEKPFECTFCDARFPLKGNLKRHIEAYHTNRERKYTCETCGSSFYRKSDIIIHIRVHTNEKPYACPMCPKKFNQIATLTRHKRIHTGEKPFSCPICFKKFRDKTLAIRHQSVHSDERKYSCHLCSKFVKSKAALNSHLKLHTNEKHNVCNYCGMAFSVKGNLKTHMNRMHSEKSGQCSICMKPFPDVEAHMRKHTGEKPFICKLCDQGFSSKRSLSHHMAYKHENMSKFKCSIGECTKTFPRASMLEFHLLKQHTNHTPYICPHCSRGFFRNSDLSRHLRISHMDAQTKISNKTLIMIE